MRYNVARTHNGVLARLREGLDISSIAQDREHLASLLSPGSEMELDLEAVTEIDMAGVQLLLALRKEASAKGGSLRFVKPGAPARNAFSLLGLSHLLEEPVVGGVAHGS